MEIKENESKFEKTKNVNIVHRFRLIKDEIHLDKLNKRIAELELKAAKEFQTVPIKDEHPQELKNLIGFHNEGEIDQQDMNDELVEKIEIAEKINLMNKIEK